ncbi:AI-2E family transporter [Tersicoccus sp. MR15.9]|uniref:AI-2E family transporter n=1 Tax=Tersicoccus mangrovi TaxID=3121635 RepID=UPI002FE5B59E
MASTAQETDATPSTLAGASAVPRRLLWQDDYGRVATRAGQTLLIVGLIAVIVWAITRVPLALIPVILALILASAITPLVGWLSRHRWPRWLAVLSSFVLILAIFAGVITAVVELVRAQWRGLESNAVSSVDRLHAFLTGPLGLTDQQIEDTRQQVTHFFSSGAVGSEALTGVRAVGEVAAGGVLMAVILFFFLKDGGKIRAFLFGFLPEPQRDKAHRAAELSTHVLGGYVRGTAIIAAIDAIIVCAALLILRVPLAVPLAVFVFIGGFIPIVGATAAGVLAVVVALAFNGPVPALIVLVVLVGANQLEHHVLQPVLMGKVLHIHGLAILLSLTVGAFLAGIVGALLAVPVAAVSWTVYKVWAGRDTPGPQPIDPAQPGAVV